ncbi:MAG TPA: type II secretion system protein [Mycobacteriales bacterium]|nr:type II secretion system protein [Mycobacteriales bacterium]
MRPLDRRRDAGFTLTELLVSIGLFSIVSAMVTAASITGLRHQTKDQSRSDALARMRIAIQRIDRDIRAADPLLSASATQVVLRETDGGVTRVVTYAVSGSDLAVSETRTAADGTTTTGPTRVLVEDLTTASAFSFAPLTGYTAPAGSSVDAATCVMSGGLIDPGCVGTITVHLVVKPPYVAPVTMSDNGTDLRNAA